MVKVIKARKLRCTGYVARERYGRNVFQILTNKHTEKRYLVILRHRWEKDFRMNLKITCVNTRNWVYSDKDLGEPL